MPNILDPNAQDRPHTKDGVTRKVYDYEYPLDLKLRPGSELHEKIKSKLLRRARDSRDKIKPKYDIWEKIDKSLTAYIPPNALDSKGRVTSETPIVIPVTYSTLETLLTYLTTAFLQKPIFKYVGVGPEDRLGAMLLEKVIDNQCCKYRCGLSLHTMFRDALAYGIGAVHPVWKQNWGRRMRKQDSGFFNKISGLFQKTGVERSTQKDLLYEGNALENIDPYMLLPDPNVPIHEVQKGEFIGWMDRDNYYSLLEREGNAENDLFNVKYLRHIDGKSTLIYDFSSDMSYKYDTTPATSTSPVDVIYMYVNLVPKEWGLGDEEYPEKWLFILAGDEVIISAKPLGLNHNMFPVSITAPDFDGYSTTPTSRLEVVYPLQETMDWLFSSHMANVRKGINDMLIVDPSLININDLQSPEPGKLIRTRRSAWGRGVEGAVKQLGVSDITRGNIQDSQYLSDLINRVSAASDSLQGMTYNRGEAKSASEMNSAKSGALSRLEKMAKIISMQALQDIGYMFASHTQQLMSEDQYVDINGRWGEDLAKVYGGDVGQAKVSPLDLVIDYDVLPYDGSMPGAEPVELWTQLFQIMGQSPEIAQQFDMPKIFKHIAYQMGAKDVEGFAKAVQPVPQQAQVMPDEQVQEEADKGNLQPVQPQQAAEMMAAMQKGGGDKGGY